MSKARILLVGAGQLGSRHLQALASLDEPASIQVVDPSGASLDTARQRWGEVNGHESVEFLPSLAGAAPEVDVAIVATAADVRRSAIESMLNRVRPSYAILEKVLFQHPDDFDAVAGLFANKGTRAWVNCPRRMWPFYQELKSRVKPPVHMDVTGTNWGLACNAIHLIDLFAYLSGAKDYFLTPSFDEGHTESKRDGFIELTGSLTADFGAAGEASVRSLASGETPFVIIIEDTAHNWKIEEGNGTAVAFVKSTGAGTEQVMKVPFQSQLTNIAVTQLLSDGECPLTPYGESWALHLPLLSAISEHLYGPGKVDRCPIT
jgi:predicted dehydrogenase